MIPPPRTVDQVAAGLADLRPDGELFQRGPDTYDGAHDRATADALATAEGSMAAMLGEVDPRTAVYLLPDYQRVLGPDPFGRDQLSLSSDQERQLVFQRWTAAPIMCAGYFVTVAAQLGISISIEEFPLSECGEFECGEEPVPYPQHCAFLVTLPNDTAWDAECGAVECGDSMGGYTPSLFENFISQSAPLYTRAVFNYV